jgi:hypothetical protein
MISDSLNPAHRVAFQATIAEILSLEVNEVGWNDHDVVVIAERVFTHIPRIQSLRPSLLQFGEEYHLEWVDALERYANAALYTFHNYRDNPEPPGSLPELVRRAAHLRNILVTDCSSFLARKMLDYKRFQDFDGGTKSHSVACDLLILRSLLDELYPKIKGECPFSPSDMREAEAFAEAILTRLMDPNERGPLVWEPADMHFRAFTLLDRAYHEARRGVQYIRWDEEDAHTFAPPLYFYNRLFERWRSAHRPDEGTDRRARFTAAAMTAVARRKPFEN